MVFPDVDLNVRACAPSLRCHANSVITLLSRPHKRAAVLFPVQNSTNLSGGRSTSELDILFSLHEGPGPGKVQGSVGLEARFAGAANSNSPLTASHGSPL